MVQNLILAFLIVGGFTGWSLFAIVLVQLFCNRQTEIKIINEIKEELKIVREEVKNLK
jgi:sensor domain CHASE-containing protein